MDKRRFTQFMVAILTNSNISGFINGKIFKGNMKKICVPGLNCYSCPGAMGACPIGALQAVIGTIKYNFSFYIVGIMTVFGVVFGRLICGMLCPFGLIQDLLYKIPLKKITLNKRIDSLLRYLKYVILVVFVILLPMVWVNEFGISQPTFCKYICPAGTLEGGLPLILKDKGLQGAIGYLFNWKLFLLFVMIVSSIIIYRPFCKYVCPLGAFYSLFNKVSYHHYSIDTNQCTQCRICTRNCKMGVSIHKDPNHLECIRCGECIKKCPKQAIKRHFEKIK